MLRERKAFSLVCVSCAKLVSWPPKEATFFSTRGRRRELEVVFSARHLEPGQDYILSTNPSALRSAARPGTPFAASDQLRFVRHRFSTLSPCNCHGHGSCEEGSGSCAFLTSYFLSPRPPLRSS